MFGEKFAILGVNMEIIFLLIGALIGGASAFAINYYYDKKDNGCDEKQLQKLVDTLNAIKAQLEKTV